MGQRIAIVKSDTGLVENIGLSDSDGGYGDPDEGFIFVMSETANINDTYANGVFTPPAPIVYAPNYKNLALIELSKSDGVAIRCAKAGQSYPAEWQQRDAALRAIVSSSEGPIPDAPDFPAGT